MKLIRYIFMASTVFTTLIGCSLLKPLSTYDLNSYKNLTNLKPQVVMLYSSFQDDRVSNELIYDLKLSLAQAYEYEVGKGKSNEDTAGQIKIIQDMVLGHINYRLRKGKWNQTIYENSVELINEAFDKAIKTESSKYRGNI